MTTDLRAALAPCPFCSSDDARIEANVYGAVFWITCGGCDSDGPVKGSESAAAAAWNDRAALAAPPQVPLTEAQIEREADRRWRVTNEPLNFAAGVRFAERHHGITSKDGNG